VSRPLFWRVGSFFVAAAFVALWQLIADRELVSPIYLPGPDRAFRALVDGLSYGLARTIERMLYGWLIASLLGIFLGCIIGISPGARAYVEPTLELLRPLPPSAMIPLAVSVLGLTDNMVIGVIGFGALWPMLLATIHGFAAVEPRLREVAAALGLSRLDVIFKIALPNALPDILVGMRLSLTVSLILAVVGEMLAGREGLGNWILVAARSFKAADLYAGVILLGAVGYASASLLYSAERILLRWRRSA
jgi:sulfonate transport system permease protein